MGAVLPAHAAGVHQLQVSLVYQRGGLQGLAGTFSGHVVARQPVEMIVDKRSEGVERVCVASAPGQQQLGEMGAFRVHLQIGRFYISLPESGSHLVRWASPKAMERA